MPTDCTTADTWIPRTISGFFVHLWAHCVVPGGNNVSSFCTLANNRFGCVASQVFLVFSEHLKVTWRLWVFTRQVYALCSEGQLCSMPIIRDETVAVQCLTLVFTSELRATWYILEACSLFLQIHNTSKVRCYLVAITVWHILWHILSISKVMAIFMLHCTGGNLEVM